MNGLSVSLRRTHPAAVLPKQAHDGDVGHDLVSVQHGRIDPGETVAIDVGWTVADVCLVQRSHDDVEWDDGTGLTEAYMKIESRSGLSLKSVFAVGGVIDAGYRGPLKVNLYNGRHDRPYDVHVGDRIGQLVIYRVAPVGHESFFETADDPTETSRGSAGYGSTGR